LCSKDATRGETVNGIAVNGGSLARACLAMIGPPPDWRKAAIRQPDITADHNVPG